MLVSLAFIACGGVEVVPETDGGANRDAGQNLDAAPVAEPNIAFVTASAASADLGGLSGADDLGNAEAQSAGLRGGGCGLERCLSRSDIDRLDARERALRSCAPDLVPTRWSAVDDIGSRPGDKQLGCTDRGYRDRPLHHRNHLDRRA